MFSKQQRMCTLTQASPNECLISNRKGHWRSALKAWRRFVDFVRVRTARGGGNSAASSRPSQLSNSQYSLDRRLTGEIIAAAEIPRDRVLLRLLAETGLRRGEIRALEIDDIRVRERLVLVRCAKNGKTRLVPVTLDLIELFRDLNGRTSKGPVFRSRKGGFLSTRQINRIVAQAASRAGVENPNPRARNVTPHLFRHSFARRWKDAGGDIETLSNILGHSSQKTTLDLYGTLGLDGIRRNYQTTIQKLF